MISSQMHIGVSVLVLAVLAAVYFIFKYLMPSLREQPAGCYNVQKSKRSVRYDRKALLY